MTAAAMNREKIALVQKILEIDNPELFFKIKEKLLLLLQLKPTDAVDTVSSIAASWGGENEYPTEQLISDIRSMRAFKNVESILEDE